MKTVFCKRYFLLFTLLIPFAFRFSAATAQEPLRKLQSMAEVLRQGSEIQFRLVATKEKVETYATRGTLLLSGDKFRLRYDVYDVCFDGKNLSYYDFKENVLTLLSADTEEMLQINPLLFVNQDPDSYEITAIDGAKAGSIIQLTPKKTKSLYQRIVVTLAKNANLPHTIEIITTENSVIKATLSPIKERKDFTEAQFVQPQSLYSNSEIVDLR